MLLVGKQGAIDKQPWPELPPEMLMGPNPIEASDYNNLTEISSHWLSEEQLGFLRMRISSTLQKDFFKLLTMSRMYQLTHALTLKEAG